MGDHARAVPSIVVHGSADTRVVPVNADRVLQQSMAANRLAAPETFDLDIARPTTTSRGQVDGGYAYTRSQWTDRRGVLMHELLEVDGLGHAWSGGAPGGSHTDPRGPTRRKRSGASSRRQPPRPAATDPHANALMPVMSRPTMSVCIVSVPS